MFVAVLATIVYTASAATTPMPTKGCCGPKKYQATLIEIGGSYVPSTGQTKSVDVSYFIVVSILFIYLFIFLYLFIYLYIFSVVL